MIHTTFDWQCPEGTKPGDTKCYPKLRIVDYFWRDIELGATAATAVLSYKSAHLRAGRVSSIAVPKGLGIFKACNAGRINPEFPAPKSPDWDPKMSWQERQAARDAFSAKYKAWEEDPRVFLPDCQWEHPSYPAIKLTYTLDGRTLSVTRCAGFLGVAEDGETLVFRTTDLVIGTGVPEDLNT